MEYPRNLSRRRLLGMGAVAVPAAILAGGILAPMAADAADAGQARTRPEGHKPAPRHQPATEVLMFC